MVENLKPLGEEGGFEGGGERVRVDEDVPRQRIGEDGELRLVRGVDDKGVQRGSHFRENGRLEDGGERSGRSLRRERGDEREGGRKRRLGGEIGRERIVERRGASDHFAQLQRQFDLEARENGLKPQNGREEGGVVDGRARRPLADLHDNDTANPHVASEAARRAS